MSARALGSWIIGDKLGEGSSGEVYRAVGPSGVTAALKLYHNRDPEFVRRSLAALQKLARVQHPNLTEVLEAGVVGAAGPAPVPGLAEPGTLFLASRLVEGQTLGDLLKQGPPDRSEAVALVGAVAGALDALHKAGLIHRDVKPSNVIVAPGRHADAVLVDLGLAGLVDVRTGQTRSGEVFGTPAYMSPEQALGRPQSAASDVWSLAALYYELRFGAPPFARDGVLETLAAVATQSVAFPDGGAIDQRDRQALARALDNDPARRFPTATAFAQALVADVERPVAASPGRTTGAMPASPPPVMVEQPPTQPYPEPSQPGLPASARAAAPAWLVPAGGALLVGLLLWVLSIATGGAWLLPVAIGAGAAGAAWLLIWYLISRRQQQRRVFSGRLHTVRRRSGRRELTDSLAISMDQLLEDNRKDPHLRLVGVSLSLVIGEYQRARDRDDRRQALEQVIKLIEILERGSSRGSWLERHQKLLALATGALALMGTGAAQLSSVFVAPVRLDGCPEALAAGERHTFSSLLRADPEKLADRVVWLVDGVETKTGGTFTFQMPAPPDRPSYLVKLTAPGVGSAECTVRRAP